jgi:hypothetical protein
MSIKNAADLVRAQGRYGDTQLMHVSPKEVEALQKIAQSGGKSLSVNPQTGLPEAFDLGAMLPAIAGTAVGSMVGMPWLGAAIGGLGTYATTGSLEKGLLAGLGSFGGASLAAGLGGAGATAGTTLSSSGAVPAAAAQTAIGPGAAAAIEGGMSGPIGAAFEGVNLAGGSPASMLNYGQTAFNALPAAQKLSAMGTGIEQLATNPADTWSAMGGLKGQGKNLAMMAAPVLGGAFSSQDTDIGTTESDGTVRQFDFDPATGQFTRRAPVKQSEFTGYKPSVYGYAEGGDVDQEGKDAAMRNQIARMYRTYLQREPDKEGVDYWMSQLALGLPMTDIQEGIKASQEGTQLKTSSDMEAFYRDYLGRRPEEQAIQDAMGALSRGVPMQEIQQSIMGSPEASGIRAASQQRQQAFNPMPSSAQQPTTQAQQMGAAMIPDRYQQPVNIPSQGVQDYNQLLSNRAAYEYTQMPMPDSMRPRTPEEKQRIIDARLAGPNLGTTRAARPAPSSKDMQTQIDEAVAAAMAQRGGGSMVGNVWYGGNQNDGDGGGGDGGDGGAAGAGMGSDGPWASGGRIKKYAEGGITSIPKFQAGGEMQSDAFVVPADVVSALGNGSTDAGVAVLNEYLGMAMPIEGEGDGLSDDIPATIDGEQPARVADGEVYIPAEVVAMLGGGNPDMGSQKLYQMMDKIREAAHGKTKQQGEVNPEQVMPA